MGRTTGSARGAGDAPERTVASIPGPQTLIVDDFPSTEHARALSPNGRAHWATKRDARKAVASEVVTAATRQPLTPVQGPVRLTFRYVFPVQRKRDIDNLTTGVTKAVIDALVRGEWIEADDSEYVVAVDAVAAVERGSRRLEVVLSPAATGQTGGEG